MTLTSHFGDWPDVMRVYVLMEELSIAGASAAHLVSICDGGHSLEFVIDGDMKAVLTNMILDSSAALAVMGLPCSLLALSI